MNHIPPCLFMSREDDDDVRDFGKHDFGSVLLQPMLSNVNILRAGQPDRPVAYRVSSVEPRGLPITKPIILSEKDHFGCLEEVKVVTRFP